VSLLATYQLVRRLVCQTDPRLLWRFLYLFGYKGALSIYRHQLRLRCRQFFPPFLYVSVINSCNLRCQGCWVDVAAKQQAMSPQVFHRFIREAKQMGNVFFGIVGGEPLMHPQLLDMLAEHTDCYFQIFTNGHFLTPEKARRMFQLGNITPLISVEGSETVSDIRRGRPGVLSKTLQGLRHALEAGLMVGVCTSVCRSNIDDLLREEWIDRLIDWGVLYTWFHVYRPMGPQPHFELCLTSEQVVRVRRFVVEMRARKPIIIIDAYHDADGQALCPAAIGLSHHINPWGDIEPCPIIQFARESIDPRVDDRPLRDKFLHSAFLAEFRQLAARTTRGCIVLERPDLLYQLVERHAARDTTVRQTARAELAHLTPRPSQDLPEHQIPEKNFLYRWAKRIFFNDFGLYQHFRNAAGSTSPRG
jgi:MoaA/NifB/PqqE/SkfB family radical SAM enzyme